MKITRVNSQTFTVDTATYGTADVFAFPDASNGGTLSLYIKNGSYSKSIFEKKPWGEFTDSSNTPYASFALASAGLAAVVAPGDGVSSVLSDKGTVTQATSATTAVTANNLNGVITTVAQTLAADTELTFTVNNSKVTTASNIILTPIYPAASAGTPVVNVGTVSAGSFTVVVTNVNPTNAMNAALKIGFLVL